ncbi:hypothetical protein ES705_31118 [subsurface metagenome]
MTYQQEWIMRYAERDGGVSVRDVFMRFSISAYRGRGLLTGLVTMGKLEQHARRSGTYYALPGRKLRDETEGEG